MNKAVVIHIERGVGESKFQKCQLQGSLPAIMEGIAVLIQQAAKAVNVPEGHLVSILATVLLAPHSEDLQREILHNAQDESEVTDGGQEERPEA